MSSPNRSATREPGSAAPRVTVVVATRNRAAWLRECLDSVLASTFEAFEVLVADNASTDATPDVVAAACVADARVRSVRRPVDVGMIANYNGCAAEVRTDYVVFLGDDDLLDPGMLGATVAFADAHPGVVMVHGAFDLIHPDGTVVLAAANWTGGLHADTVEPGAVFAERAMPVPCRVCSSTALVRTRDGARVGWFRPDEAPPVDLGLWLRLAMEGDIAFLQRRLARYRLHPGSHSASLSLATEDGYVLTAPLIRRVYEVKAAFVAANRGRLPDPRRMLAAARAGRVHDLLVLARAQTLPARRLWPTIRALASAAGEDPRVLAAPEAWALLAGAVVGPAVVDRVKGRR